jgi:eukaryotic-like serine/threonine-protein kinase
MPDRDEILADTIGKIADGAPIDWVALESRAASDSMRALIAELKIVAGVAELARRAPIALADQSPVRQVPVTWGHLKILEPIGRGAFGEVYRAWDSRLDREVALKLLTDVAGDPTLGQTSIIGEGRLLARIRHPNVVTVYGAERLGDVVGIWMELVRGRSLHQIVQEDGPLDVVSAARIGIDLCRALSAVHAAGLVHRDIKAHNVLREEDGRTVLMDFGTGGDRAEPEQLASALAGTPLYLAPELFLQHPATPESDIYSVGVLLFYLVTGAFPTTATTLKDVRAAHDQGRYMRLGDLRPDLPDAYVRAIERAVAATASERYQTASDFERALADVVARSGGGAVSASEPARGGDGAALVPRSSAPAAGSRSRARVVFATVLMALAALVVGLFVRTHPMSTESTQVARLIPNPPCAGAPSADGRWVACIEWPQSMRDRRAPLAHTLVLFNTETGDRRILKTAPQDQEIMGATIAPNGTRVAYVERTRGSAASVHVINLNEGSDRFVAAVPSDVSMLRLERWSSTDDLIESRLWLSSRTHAFALLSPESGAFDRVLELPQSPQGIARSPDGRRIAFDVLQADGAPERDIRVCDLTSKACATIAHPASDFLPFWTPDGRLLFNSDRGRTIGLWGMDVRHLEPSSSPELVADLGRAWLSAFAFAASGKLFHSKRVGDFDVYSATFESPDRLVTHARLSSRAAGMIKGPAWSADGHWLAFVSQRGPFQERGASRLVLRRTSDGVERELAFEFNVVSARLAWSPSGQRLAFRGLSPQTPPSPNAGIHLIDPLTGRIVGAVPEPVPLPEGRGTFMGDFAWIDDRRLVFSNAAGLGEMDVATGAWRALWTAPSGAQGFGVALSPDARRMASVARAQDSSWFAVVVLPSTGGEAREVLRVSRPEVMAVQCWTADGNSLLVTRRDGSQPQEQQRDRIWRVPLDGSEPVALGITEYGLHDVRAHPDGHQIAFVAGGGRNEFWTLAGLVK